MKRIDVRREGERHNVGRETIDHRTSLFARTTVRLFNRDGVARLFFPVTGESRVVINVEFPRRIVGNIE